MKSSIVLFILMILITSCGDAPKVESPNANLSGAKPVGDEFKPALQVMNYSEFNSNLQKQTGVNVKSLTQQANKNALMSLFDQIKGTLPSNGEIESMTSFNLVSMTRLADLYCGFFVNGERNATFELISGGFPGMNDSLFSSFNAVSMRKKLMNSFMDYEEDDSKFTSLEEEIDHILANSDGQGGTLIEASIPEPILRRNLTVLGCIAAATSTESILKQ